MALYLGNEKIAGNGSATSITPEDIGAAKDDLSNIDNIVFAEKIAQATGGVGGWEIIETTLSASGWSNNTYSFESSYPHADYDIEIQPNNTCTTEQIKTWCDAQIVGSATSNVYIALGTIPTIDIPIIIRVVMK